MPTFTITIPGHARGKQRPRFSSRGGIIRAYTPKETVNAEAWIRLCCIQQVGSPCLEGPLSVSLSIDVAVPQSWSNKKRLAALAGEISPTGKPDLSNSVKLMEDSLNGILWRDDSQIVTLSAAKRYAADPSTVLIVSTIDCGQNEAVRPSRVVQA